MVWNDCGVGSGTWWDLLRWPLFCLSEPTLYTPSAHGEHQGGELRCQYILASDSNQIRFSHGYCHTANLDHPDWFSTVEEKARCRHCIDLFPRLRSQGHSRH